jgi:hypothetical protein
MRSQHFSIRVGGKSYRLKFSRFSERINGEAMDYIVDHGERVIHLDRSLRDTIVAAVAHARDTVAAPPRAGRAA